jgi:hypothetical protein
MVSSRLRIAFGKAFLRDDPLGQIVRTQRVRRRAQGVEDAPGQLAIAEPAAAMIGALVGDRLGIGARVEQPQRGVQMHQIGAELGYMLLNRIDLAGQLGALGSQRRNDVGLGHRSLPFDGKNSDGFHPGAYPW